MSDTLQNTNSLKLIDKDGELVELDNFKNFEDHGDDTKKSYKYEDVTKYITCEAYLDGKAITVRIECMYGNTPIEVVGVEVGEIPDGYEIDSYPEFEFQECEDDEW